MNIDDKVFGSGGSVARVAAPALGQGVGVVAAARVPPQHDAGRGATRVDQILQLGLQLSVLKVNGETCVKVFSHPMTPG